MKGHFAAFVLLMLIFGTGAMAGCHALKAANVATGGFSKEEGEWESAPGGGGTIQFRVARWGAISTGFTQVIYYRNMGREYVTFNGLASLDPITIPVLPGRSSQDGNTYVHELAPGSEYPGAWLNGPHYTSKIHVQIDHIVKRPAVGDPLEGL